MGNLGDGELNINFGPIDPDEHAGLLPAEGEPHMVFGGTAVIAGTMQLQDGIFYPMILFRFAEPTPNEDGSPRFRSAALVTSQDEMANLPALVHQAVHAALVNVQQLNAQNN